MNKVFLSEIEKLKSTERLLFIKVDINCHPAPDMPVMSILGRFLALRTTTVSLAAAGWWHTDTRSSPRPWSFSCRHNQKLKE